MSISEAAAFERDLLQDKDLNAEYEMLRDISQAAKDISEEELRSMLAKAEKEAQSNPIVVDKKIINAELNQIEKELHDIYGIEDSVPKWYKRFLNKLKAWFLPDAYGSAKNNHGQSLINLEQQGSTVGLSYSLRLAISFAVVACLALAVVLPINHHLAVSGFSEAGRILESGGWQLNTLRGDNNISDLLKECYSEIHGGNYQEAQIKLVEAEKLLDEQADSLSGDNSAISELAELEQLKQDIAWCKALILMHDKKVGKAKHLLKGIAKSEGKYSLEAKRILKEIY